jgi:CheY-like chemotaxis protein
MSSVTHELRTPLTSIRAFSELLRDDPKMHLADRERFLGLIVSEAERLTRLINQTLDLAKIESGRADWNGCELDLKEVIEQSMAATSQLFREKEAHVELDLPDNLPLDSGRPGSLDPGHAESAVQCGKVPDAGQWPGSRGAAPAGGWTGSQCRRQRTGNSPGRSALIFEKFRQVGDTMTAKPSGTGLGLPISRRIVEHFGGRSCGWKACRARGRPSALPCLSRPSGASATRRLRQRSRMGGSLMIGVLMSKKILIADDEQNIVISIEFLLRREGFEVLVAGDGEEALAKVRAERPDLVLLDVMMPRMNGFDVCQALRADPDLSATRILMLTAKGRDTEVSKGLGLGADGYMTKPFSTKELLAEVRKLLGCSRMKPTRKLSWRALAVCLFLLAVVVATAP